MYLSVKHTQFAQILSVVQLQITSCELQIFPTCRNPDCGYHCWLQAWNCWRLMRLDWNDWPWFQHENFMEVYVVNLLCRRNLQQTNGTKYPCDAVVPNRCKARRLSNFWRYFLSRTENRCRDRLRKDLEWQSQYYIMASKVASRGSRKYSGFQCFLWCRGYKMVCRRQYGGCRVHWRKSSRDCCEVS